MIDYRHTILAICVATWLAPLAAADDWPTYRHDTHRSGASEEPLNAAELALAWVYRSPVKPQPAWWGAADVDAYRKIRGLGDGRQYDPVFHCIASAGRVYFGSTADDAVHALDMRTGAQQWTYTTGGPIRVAPTVAGGKVYFGSDDGSVYAVTADRGELAWQFQPPAPKTRIINDGRLISLWPCRTGVLVDRGTAYFAMSLFAWKPTFVCAIDAATGKAAGAAQYVRRVEEGLTLEAALLATGSRLIAPQGRSGAVLLDRQTGQQISGLSGASTFALVTPGESLVSGPSSRDIGLRGSNVEGQQSLAWHPGAIAIVATGSDYYVLGPESLSSTNSVGDTAKWSVPLKGAVAAVAAQNAMIIGCDGEVVAVDRASGKKLWRAAVVGKAYGLAVAEGSLLVSTDEGAIYAFRAGLAAPTPVAQPSDTAAVAVATPSGPFEPQDKLSVQLPLAPYAQFISPTEAVIRWQTAQPSPTLLRYTIDGRAHRVEQAELRTEHAATIVGLPQNRICSYQVLASQDGKIGAATGGNLDTFFNYSAPPLADRASPYGAATETDPTSKLAEQILQQSRQTGGMCIVFGAADGKLAWQLARQSQLRVLVVAEGAQVRPLREFLQQAGVYGPRLTVVEVESLGEPSLPAMMANLVVDEQQLRSGKQTLAPEVAARFVRPQGGTLVLATPAANVEPSTVAALKSAGFQTENVSDAKRSMLVAIRGKLPGAGDWSHQYGAADNAGFAGESLGGSRTATDLEVQWFGRPGPRDHADRQTRHPAPLSMGGRLYIQGQERIVTLDAFNGTPLWSLEIPGLERYDIPHDSGNWAADEGRLYVVVGDRCWVVDAATGRVTQRYPVIPGRKPDGKYDWGFIAATDRWLVGSANTQGVNSKGWWGEYWRDEESNTEVASDNLFAIDKETGHKSWTYVGGIIPNCSITVADNRIYFIESRDPKSIEGYGGRVFLTEAWPDRYLVALDLASGEKVWEKAVALKGGQALFGMASANGKLVISSSGGGKYYVYAFNGATGGQLWQQTVDWGGRGHGAQYSRPVVVDGTIFIRPFALELETGKVLPIKMPGGGCGTYCASSDALFFRSGDITAWSPDTEQLSGFSRLRSGCWLSAIPAAGMLLSPEAGGGCSCGGWMETSVGFAPAQYPPPSIKSRDRSFVDEHSVELFNHVPGGEIHWTGDGSAPSLDSPRYERPLRIDRTSTIQAATYFRSPGREPVRSETMTATLSRQYPGPSLPGDTTAFTDTLVVEIKKNGRTGTIHYTLDGSEPTAASPVYEPPLTLTDSAKLACRTIWQPADGAVIESPIARQEFQHVTKRSPREVNIKFQSLTTPRPEGFVPDNGQTFRVQPSGYAFGWTKDMRSQLRSRGKEKDILHHYFMECVPKTAWELEVDNGRYEVTVCIGETFYGTENGTIYVEGVEFCKDVFLPRTETREFTKTIEVTDGRLSVTSHDDARVQKSTRLNYLRMRRVD